MKKHWIFILVFFVLGMSYRNWFSSDIFGYGDWIFYYKNSLESLQFFSIWSSQILTFGNVNQSLWALPIQLTLAVFGSFGFDFNIAEKFVYFFPTVFLPPLGGYLLTRKITGSKIGGGIGALVCSANTYFLSINTQGHELLTIACGIGFIAIWLFTELDDRRSLDFVIYTALTLFFVGAYDFRVAYITVAIMVFYLLFFLCVESKKKERLIFLSLPLLLFTLFSLYWLLPVIVSGGIVSGSILERELYGDQFWSLLSAVSLFYPFWTESGPVWFEAQKIPLFFWMIPLAAFLGFWLNKKKAIIIFYALIALVGIFLSKQSDAPLESLYPFLREYLPGFSAFREATKFYFVIILGYTVLISQFAVNVYDYFKSAEPNSLYKKLALGVLCIIPSLFLWNLKPMLLNEIGMLYVPREIPQDYNIVKEFLLQEEEYSRVLWVPNYSRWSFHTVNHPMLGAAPLVQYGWNNLSDFNMQREDYPKGSEITYVINNGFSDSLLDISSIKYVIVPLQDTKNEDNFFSYYGKREYFINELSRADYLKKMSIGTKEVAIFKNENSKPHIYTTDEPESIYKNIKFDEVDFEFKSSQEYIVHLKNITHPIHLNFSEQYHPLWRLKIGGLRHIQLPSSGSSFLEKSIHSENDARLNSFLINPLEICLKDECSINSDGSYDLTLTIYFESQSYYNLGFIISSLTILICLGYLVVSKTSRKKFLFLQ